MAPLAKTDSFPAVSLLLVKPVQNQVSDDKPVSRYQLMQLIYTLMLLVGTNTSIIQNSFAQNQLEMATVAQNESTVTHTATVQFMHKLDEYNASLATSKSWGVFASVMKWVGVGIGILLGGLLCETPLGFVILASVIGFTASPGFAKTTEWLGGLIGNQAVAQGLMVAALTLATAGIEGGYVTASVFTQTLISSNLIGECATGLVNLISPHGDEQTKKWWIAGITLVATLLVTFVSFRFASSSANIMSSLSNNVKMGVGAFVGIAQMGSSAAQGGNGYYTYEQGTLQGELAPIEANVMSGQGLGQILNQITNLSQQVYKSLMESNKILFETDFSSDWKSCVDAQQIQA